MILLRDHSPIPAEYTGAVLALGNFDGLHVGHAAILAKTLQLAKETNRPAGVLTFEPHPRRILRPETATLALLPLSEKLRRLQGSGMQMLRLIHFTKDFSHTTAGEFVSRVLKGALGVSQVVTGENFFFGHNREGNAAYLQKAAKEQGFGYTACAPVMVGNAPCSSTRVRTALGKGAVREAALLLGHPHSISGRVQQGDKRGRTLGFPTLNIIPGNIFTPLAGVYAVQTTLRGKTIAGVANLGTRPTFGGTRLQLEVHLFDWNQDVYGEKAEVAFIERIRDEKKFNGIDALKKQIEKDCEGAKIILSIPSPLAGEG